MIRGVEYPFPVAEQIHIFRPIALVRIRQKLVGGFPFIGSIIFFAVVAVIGNADVLRLRFGIVLGQPVAEGGQAAQRQELLDAVRRGVVLRQADARAVQLHIEVDVDRPAGLVGIFNGNNSSC